MRNINLNKIITVMVLIIVVFAVILLFKNSNGDDAALELNGLSEMVIYENDQFIDPGYNIVGTDNTNGYYINIDGYVNNTKMGVYQLKYLLFNSSGELVSEAVRRVVVLKDTVSNITMELIGDAEEYFMVGDYIDHGISAYQGNSDISSMITIDSNVNKDVVGDYTVKYQYKNGNSFKELQRIIHIVDLNVKEEIDIKNRRMDLTMDVDDYSYTMLPDNYKEYSKFISYSFDKVGIYEFNVYLKSGSSKKYEVNIKSIDSEGPKGSCTLYHENGKTKITMKVTDPSGILKYSYNGLDFHTNTTTLNKLTPSVTVKAYDNFENVSEIKCKSEYGTGFRAISVDGSGHVQGKSGYIVCGTSVTNESKELAELVRGYGLKTRGAVAAAGTYLAQYKYNIPYFWGGKYVKPGFNPQWGCRQKTYGKVVCSKPLGGEYCEWGLDCTGFTSWAFAQAGFDYNIIRQDKQSEGNWGNFNAGKHRYAFTPGNLAYANQIKPGDIVQKPGHVGLVIGVSADTIQVAEMTGPIIIDVIRKSNGVSTNGQSNFTNFVLFDDFYKMYGN